MQLPKEEKGRNIVVCCDGTGNEFGDSNSNVVKLYSTLHINEEQVGYYHPGVGTMAAPNSRNWIERTWTKLKGLAFGAGFTANVEDAYRYLMETYRDGDKIYIFGFSRGAYTARSLAGMLAVCGLLCKGNEGLIPYAWRLFAARIKNPNQAAETLAIAARFKQAFSHTEPVSVEFLGVWDTVSSVGWITDPVVLPDEFTNPIVKTARHAISIDERRCYYHDKLFGDPFKACAPGSELNQDQDFKQVWFAGVHSDVGGSYSENSSCLSKLTLEWMLREAYGKGLKINLERANQVLGRDPSCTEYKPPDPAADQHVSLKGGWWLLEVLPHTYYDKSGKRREWRVPFGAWRTIPDGSVLHESVVDRLQLRQNYRPPNLPKLHKTEPRITFPSATQLQSETEMAAVAAAGASTA